MKKIIGALVTAVLLSCCVVIFGACEQKCLHPNTEWIIITAATCEGEGEKELRCTKDNTVIETGKIDALGHAGEWVTINAATCEDGGEKELRCTRDSVVLDTGTIEALGHEYDTNVTDATCTTAGVTIYTCIHDDTHTYSTPIAVLGHDAGEWITVEAATCEDEGEKELRCTRDSVVLDTGTIEALGHEYGSKVTDPTCTTAGATVYTCKNDDTHTYSTPIAALGHDAGEWETAEDATCEDEGEKELRCTRDNAILDTESIAAIGHDYETTVKAPTCSGAGKTTYTCKNDNSHTYSTPIAALPHNYGEWEFYSEATDRAPEREKRVCANNSNHIDYRYIAHELKLDETSAADNVDGDGKWFELILAQDTQIQLGFMQYGADSVSSRLSARLYSNSLTWLGTADIDAPCVKELAAGTYYIRLAWTGSGEASGSVYVGDFGKVIKAMEKIELDRESPTTTVDNIGTWYSFELSDETLVQFTHKASGSFVACLYAEDNLTNALFGSNPYLTKIRILPAGTYYIRMYSNFASAAPSGLVKLIDMTSILNAADELEVGDSTPTQLVSTEGTWYKLSITQKTDISFIFYETNYLDLKLTVYLDDENLTRFSSFAHNGGNIYVATLNEGTYYLLFYTQNNSGTTGSLEITDFAPTLTAAPILTIGTPSDTVTIGKNGIWFRFSLEDRTIIKLKVQSAITTYGYIYNIGDMNHAISTINNVIEMDKGEYYLFVYAGVTLPGTGTVKIENYTDELNSKPELELGTPSEEAVVDFVDGLWYKLVITENTYVSLSLSISSGSINAAVYSETDINTIKIYAYGSTVGTSYLSAGTYYVKLSASSDNSKTCKGTVLVEKTIF